MIEYLKEKIMNNLSTGTPLKNPLASIETKKRHGCLIAWLIQIILVSAIFVVLYLARTSYPQYSPDQPAWASPILITIGIIQIVCIIAVFKWKKWGFWGYCIICAIAFITNIWLGVVITAVGTLFDVVILCATLNLGKSNKGWRHLN
jgi:membrane-associated HD superfamily phosphohydrolase